MNKEIDIPSKYFEAIHYVIQGLIRLDPERETPAGELLRKLALAVADYESNYFKFGIEK